jgi:hypothetical protein
MTDTAGTASQGDEAQQAPAAGTPAQPDEVTTLRSRNAGLDAKVTELQKAAAAAQQARDEALARLSDYENGKVKADEALSAQLAAKDAELAAVRKEATLARVAAKYPETFGVLGDAAAALSEDQLAASEARMTAGFVPETPVPTPIGNNPGRQQAAAPKSLEDMSATELEKALRGLDPSVLMRHQ